MLPLHQRGRRHYIRSTHRASAGIEPWPRHSQCRVLPLHQTRRLDIRFRAEEEGLEPSPPVKGRPRLANACDKPVFASLPLAEARIEKRVARREMGLLLTSHFWILTSLIPCPRQESNLDFELRTLAWFSVPPRGRSSLPSPGFEPGPQRSKRRMISISPRGRVCFVSLLASDFSLLLTRPRPDSNQHPGVRSSE